jgi:predicted TIM-barrel fold metal-dependent hydrolase
MFNGQKVLDIHGHMSAPLQFRNYMFGMMSRATYPAGSNLRISDEVMDTTVSNHVRGITRANIDFQILSPRPVAMMHWEAFSIQSKWASTTNDVIAQMCRMYPDRFAGMAQLPQNNKLDTSTVVPELERSVKEFGFVGAIVNPDPSGTKEVPGLNDPYWYPLYEKAQELNVGLMIHPSVLKDPRVEVIPHNYQINNVWEEYLATLIYVHTDVFQKFPELKVAICHCGGALSRHFNEDMRGGPNRQEIRDRFKNNLWFDTCCYDKDVMEATVKQKGVDAMVFGTEIGGGGGGEEGGGEGGGARAARPEGAAVERPAGSRNDVVGIIDSLEFLTAEDKHKIFNTNVIKAFPRVEKLV